MEPNQLDKQTFQTVIFACFGGFSNTGITTGYASINAVKELKLDKACIGCLTAVSQNVQSVIESVGNAKKIITVDGCPKLCAKKELERMGFTVTNSIVLTEDTNMKKRSFSEVFKGGSMNISDYIVEAEIEVAKNRIIEAITGN